MRDNSAVGLEPPKVLVLVCAYNEQAHISKCLHSISESINYAGRIDSFKLVCVDNSSTDNTGDIARGFSSYYGNYEYLKISHSPLCVSRNSYKLFDDFDFVAYIDGDGGVDKCWAKNLMNILHETQAPIISGPVKSLSISDEPNRLWEVFYDSNLDDGQYLIGANMIFSKKFLDSVNGFPKVFPSRGDESCLLLKARLMSKDFTIDYNSNLIAFNHFPSDYRVFFNERFTDGMRSAQICKLWGKPVHFFMNVLFRSFRLLSVGSAIALAPLNLKFSLVFFMLSLFLILFNKPSLISRILGKAISRSNPATIFGVFSVIGSFYLFDLGYIRGLVSDTNVSKSSIFSSSTPSKSS